MDGETTNKLKTEHYEKLTEEIMNRNEIPTDTIVICVSYKPDKRGRFYKYIIKEGTVKTFSPLEISGLKSFIKQQMEELDLTAETISAIITKV